MSAATLAISSWDIKSTRASAASGRRHEGPVCVSLPGPGLVETGDEVVEVNGPNAARARETHGAKFAGGEQFVDLRTADAQPEGDFGHLEQRGLHAWVLSVRGVNEQARRDSLRGQPWTNPKDWGLLRRLGTSSASSPPADGLSDTAVALSEPLAPKTSADRDSVTDGQDHLLDAPGRLSTGDVIVDHALVTRVDLAVRAGDSAFWRLGRADNLDIGERLGGEVVDGVRNRVLPELFRRHL